MLQKKQYKKIDNALESDGKEKATIKKYNQWNLIYNNKYSSYKYYHGRKNYDNISLKSKYCFLNQFFNKLNKLNDLKLKMKKCKRKNRNSHPTASEVCSEFLETYYAKHNEFLDVKKGEINKLID